MTAVELKRIVTSLAKTHPPSPQLTDALQLILWENIGYLIADERRASLFAEFEERVGFEANAIAKAASPVLMDMAVRGGMQPARRVAKWREIARLVLTETGGDLSRALRTLPVGKARALLKKFPGIADPGADKILLFEGIATLPAVESNGVRTLVRLGCCAEEKSYAATYKGAVRVLAKAGGTNRKWLMTAYTVLRDHGKALCKRGKPLCLACPLDRRCAHTPVARL